MSWFVLSDQPVHKKRRGIWIRYRFSPDVLAAIKKSKLRRMTEDIEWVEILELRKDNKVLLEVWCQSVVDALRGINRHNVFHILVDENPEWVCEGDLGRGL